MKPQNVKFFDETQTIITKIKKRAHAFKNSAQLKNTEFAIRNKLKELLTEFKGFRFMITLFLDIKKIESDDETEYSTFY